MSHISLHVSAVWSFSRLICCFVGVWWVRAVEWVVGWVGVFQLHATHPRWEHTCCDGSYLTRPQADEHPSTCPSVHACTGRKRPCAEKSAHDLEMSDNFLRSVGAALHFELRVALEAPTFRLVIILVRHCLAGGRCSQTEGRKHRTGAVGGHSQSDTLALSGVLNRQGEMHSASPTSRHQLRIEGHAGVADLHMLLC